MKLYDKKGPKWYKVQLYFASLHQTDQTVHRIKSLTNNCRIHRNCTAKIDYAAICAEFIETSQIYM